MTMPDSGRPTLLMCPECARRGVQVKQTSRVGEDAYVCRFGCGFYAFTEGHAQADVTGRKRLLLVNPEVHTINS